LIAMLRSRPTGTGYKRAVVGMWVQRTTALRTRGMGSLGYRVPKRQFTSQPLYLHLCCRSPGPAPSQRGGRSTGLGRPGGSGRSGTSAHHGESGMRRQRPTVVHLFHSLWAKCTTTIVVDKNRLAIRSVLTSQCACRGQSRLLFAAARLSALSHTKYGPTLEDVLQKIVADKLEEMEPSNLRRSTEQPPKPAGRHGPSRT
jgi:hypothetical protein